MIQDKYEQSIQRHTYENHVYGRIFFHMVLKEHAYFSKTQIMTVNPKPSIHKLNNKLKWQGQIGKILIKASRNIYILHQMKNFLLKHELITLCHNVFCSKDCDLFCPTSATEPRVDLSINLFKTALNNDKHTLVN